MRGHTNFLQVSSFQNMYKLFAEIGLELAKIGLKNTYFQVFPGFPALKETVAHKSQIGQNGESYKNSAGNIFLTL